MPYFTRQVAPNGALVLRAIVGVSKARREALLLSGQLAPPAIPVDALVDTGASCTCVDPAVLQKLGIPPSGQTSVLTPSTGNQAVSADQYDVSLVILATNQQPPLAHAAIPVVASELSGQGFQMLLGRDVLRGCLLTYDGISGLFSLAY